jgi:dsRNA-specific ribonuclease
MKANPRSKLKDFNTDGWNAFSFDVKQRKNKQFDFMGTNCLTRAQVNMVFMQIFDPMQRCNLFDMEAEVVTTNKLKPTVSLVV